ncbi:MAG TPA: ECF-type sigma factor [Bryobacterales bacterium]|nr:ECF-type sigma factor [Bryobacterales bacterium]
MPAAVPRSAEITKLLKPWSGGDDAALESVVEQVCAELPVIARRYMKNERQGNTLQATAFVNEVDLHLVDVTHVDWQERAQFFAMAAQMMPHISVDKPRARASDKRGGRVARLNIEKTP